MSHVTPPARGTPAPRVLRDDATRGTVQTEPFTTTPLEALAITGLAADGDGLEAVAADRVRAVTVYVDDGLTVVDSCLAVLFRFRSERGGGAGGGPRGEPRGPGICGPPRR